MNKLTQYIENNKVLRRIEEIILVLLVAGSLMSFYYGYRKVNCDPGALQYKGPVQMQRDRDQEDCDEDSTVCDAVYTDGEKKLSVSCSYKEYEELDDSQITAHAYETADGITLLFLEKDPSTEAVREAYGQIMANRLMPVFNLANALAILALSLLIVLLFSQFFSTYEKIWFLSIMVLATIFAVLFPEESANGISGIIIMLLYLLDTFLNILCELLISKQSRYNFLVSVLVEITEIAICLILMYRFATMAVTLFFWLPIDILSYINWTRHRDDDEDELTAVRRLKGYQELLVILGIALWTIVVGYFLSGLDIRTDFFGGDRGLEILITYLDACASAVGVANGLFIFFRLREQWIAWYVCAFLEAVINVLSGQYVLLILKLGYFTNTTYGYIKWSRYIRSHAEKPSLF